MNSSQRVLSTPKIASAAVDYGVWQVLIGCIASIIGIVLLPIAVPLAYWYYGRFYGTLKVVLTSREIQVDRGIWVREEKSIPLEKITDLAAFQGPIMRYLGLKGLQIETAGQSSGNAALVKLIGLDDTDGFRELALRQRDRVTEPEPEASNQVASGAPTAVELLGEIRDSLIRIEERLTRQDPESSS